MGLAHLIASGFREIAAGPQSLIDALPGGIRSVGRGDGELVYPMGLLQVRETEREYNSGGSSLASYELMLTVFSQQGQRFPAEITRLFGSWIHRHRIYFPTIPSDAGSFVSIVQEGAGTFEEDPDDEYGRDCDRASITWTVMLSELESMNA